MLFYIEIEYICIYHIRINGIMVIVFTSSGVDLGSRSRSGQTKHWYIVYAVRQKYT